MWREMMGNSVFEHLRQVLLWLRHASTELRELGLQNLPLSMVQRTTKPPYGCAIWVPFSWWCRDHTASALRFTLTLRRPFGRVFSGRASDSLVVTTVSACSAPYLGSMELLTRVDPAFNEPSNIPTFTHAMA